MITNFTKINEYVFELPRGGYILHKDDIYIQFGTPPETIKDTMLTPQSVPSVFVLPDKFFNWIKGISVAEMEFPIYFNFFLRKSKTKIVCSLTQKEQFELLLKESIFGPKDFNISEDFSPYSNLPAPNIKAEMYFFGSHFSFEDMIDFYIFENNQCKLDNNITITKNQKFFSVYQNADKISDVPINITSKPSYDIGIASRYPFEPPLFGITCLGPSHGFDPTQNTSGFILWLNNSGIMIDPPVNSTEWLLDSNVNPKFIDSIILTHCHADHDAGTLQKILEEGKINVYTTKTVMYSFLNKYSSFTGVKQEYLLGLFDFHRVFIGNPTFIHGGEFNFFYSLHSIPTVGFHLNFQNRTFIYSSDHNNDPEIHKQMLEQKVISQERYNELRNFPWETDIIYHEAGIAPLHTPIAVLNQLPVEIQQKITTYHISAKDFPQPGTTNLKLAKFGIEETKYLDCIPNANNETCNVIKILKNLDFLDNISTEKVLEFIRIVDKKSYPKGTKIVRKGDIGDNFYIIQSGKVSVKTEGLKVQKIYSEYDYFGEVSIITSAKRTADVVSETDVVAYIIEKKKFLSFIAGTEFETILRKLVKTRDTETWNLLSTSKSFYFLTSTQKTWLEALFETENYNIDDKIIKQSEIVDKFYIIRSGKVMVLKDNIQIATLEKGNFIGEFYEIVNQLNSSYSFIAESEVKLYYINKENIIKFTKRNPGLIMKLKYEIQLNI